MAGPEMAWVVNEFLRGLEKIYEEKPGKTIICGLVKVLITPLSYHSRLS